MTATPLTSPMSAGRTKRLWPLAVGAAVAGAVVLAAFNFAALTAGPAHPWIPAVDLALDLLVLGAGIAYLVRQRLRADARTARVETALEESQTKLAAIVDSAMDAIITVDHEQRIVLFNRAAEAVFRCPTREALGEKLDRFLPMRFRESHRAHIERFGDTGVTNRRMGEATVLWALRGDGQEFPIEASISQTGEPGRRFFTVILRDVTRRKQTDDALRRQQEELREISAHMLEAREDEKTLIARELHDELGQFLTTLKMDLSWLRERLPLGELTGKAEQMNALLDQTVGSVRRIAADLRPLMLDDLGLADASAWLVEEFTHRSGLKCRLQLPAEGALDDIERNAATTVYRALQESLTNIARHAQAQHAWVVLAVEDGTIQLEVEDDGRGIAVEAPVGSRSLGLKGMRERVSYLGGMFEIGLASRGGTRVRVRVPMQPARRENPA